MTTIPAALRDAATRFPDHDAVVDGPVRLTYAELHERVRACARLFIAEGVDIGDRVAICAPNTHHWVEAALGALYAGATLVPVNTRYTGPEIVDILVRTQAKALVVAGEFLGVDRLELIRAATDDVELNLRAVLRTPEWADIPHRGGSVDDAHLDARRDRIEPSMPSDILFTSGTTGRSKGAVSSHAQALGVARAWADVVGLTDTDRYLIVNPFFHTFGYKAGILAALQCGVALYPQLTFNVETTFRMIEQERISVLPGVPTIYQTMLDHPARTDFDLTSLRAAVTGAATVPVVLVERMREVLEFDVVLTAYGLSEAVVATMCRRDDPPEIVATTCGRATADMEVRIGERGEVLLRGPNVMLGYLDDPAATAAAIDADGWLHTGDVGALDEDGNLTITDRLKDMYVSGGFNVYPAEVEQAIARLDGVSESAVIGVPDRRLGEVGKAYVVTAPGRELTADDVIAHCKTRLANYKVPKTVGFLARLPRNATGKVLKRELRKLIS